MKNAWAVLFGFALGLALAYGPADAGPRPPGEFAMLLKLNGEPSRPTQTDGGPLTLYAASGVGSIPVTGGQVYMIGGCTNPINLCVVDHSLATWDGGCNNTTTDPNFGNQLAATTNRWVVTQENTITVAGQAQDGGALSCAVFLMR